MAFTNQTLKSGPYDTNGSVTAFTGAFHCLAEDQLAVTLTDADGVESTLTLTTDYTVAGTFPTDSFTVNTVLAYAAGQTITISRATPLTQESSFGNSGPYYPKTHEQAYDKSMVAIQEVQEQVDRCVKNSVSSASTIDSAEYLAACEAAAASAAASASTVTQSATRTVALRATANVDISTGLVAGQSIDGVVLVAGDRVLLDQQSTATEDGVYIAVAAGTGTRTSDWAVGDSVSGRLVTVTEGTANAGYIFFVTNAVGSDVVGTDGLTLVSSLGGLKDDVTITVETTTTRDEIQASIDALPKWVEPGVDAKLTIQFEDGVHLWSGVTVQGIVLQDFNYDIEILGNDSETTLSTTKSVEISAAGVLSSTFTITRCKRVFIGYMKVTHKDKAGLAAVKATHSVVEAAGMYILGGGTVYNSSAIDISYGIGSVTNCYVSNQQVGIGAAYSSTVYSQNNDDTGTLPAYGLSSQSASTIGKANTGAQPSGSTADEFTVSGGVIR